MANYDIPLHMVTEGMFLFLGDDELFDSEKVVHYFCEPAKVVEVHYGPPSERFAEGALTIIFPQFSNSIAERICCLKIITSYQEIVVVVFPDDQHSVAGVNLPFFTALPLPRADASPFNKWWQWASQNSV